MNRLVLAMAVASCALTGCATEKLTVTVTDNEGMPVSNARVRVGYSTSNVIFGGGHRSSGSDSGYAESQTGADGVAVVKFNCTSSDFGWSVSAEGYYKSDIFNGHFAFDEIIIPPGIGKVILNEHEKYGRVTLWEIKNPQPMYAHYSIEDCKWLKENGRYGFDLKLFDWVAPYGDGQEADFYVVRDYTKPTEEGRFRVGTLEFERGGGFYLAENNGNENFQTAYHADTNAVFVSSVPLQYEHYKDGAKEFDVFLPLVDKKHHIVLRTRVKYDENGNMVSAHYSRILGEFSAMPFVSVSESIFNPVPNDTNLEFDRGRNLYKPPKRRRRK